MKTYHITREDPEVEGLIAIKLVNKLNYHPIVVIGSYLPPESSVHTQNADNYFQDVVDLVYDFYDEDLLLLCGDYNARVSNKADFVDTVDSLPARIHLDNTSNDHGISLVNFCIQTNVCIVNGRISPLKDGFTSVSH